uniref:8 kDa glycoprotein n=1 Tax=Taenia multiceps TaxID=94034 RepID=B6E474_TAEMU|nr:8 kDa glycoprotein [Taenia multiceps]
MRAYIVLLALTVFVVTISAEKNKTEDGKKGIINGLDFVNNLFDSKPIRQKIAQLVKKWIKTVLEARSKFQASLNEYCRALTNNSA